MKHLYRQFCDAESTVPLFSQAWWLDAVASDQWDVVLVTRGDEVAASMPFISKKRMGKTSIHQPQLTRSLGPWIRDTGASHAKRIAREKELMDELLDLLPGYGHFHQHWDVVRENWLPFYWRGFSQTTRYTYRLDDLTDLDKLWSGIQQNIRAQIRKARDKKGIAVRSDLPLADFLDLHRMVFERQGMPMPYPESLVEAIDSAAAQRGQRKIFVAQDADGRNHAAVYMVWDHHTAYYLMGGADPALRNSGAASLCMWEAIKHASSVSSAFDFEGSMIEPIERFFRAFGAMQTPYHSVSHTPSRLMRLARFVREEL